MVAFPQSAQLVAWPSYLDRYSKFRYDYRSIWDGSGSGPQSDERLEKLSLSSS